MTAGEVRFVQSTFDLDRRGLARSLNVSPATVDRWESGESLPAGLHEEVLRALHGVAVRVVSDDARRERIAGLVALGVGALVAYLIRREVGLE